MKGSEAIANILKQEGVKHVPCFPGGGAIDIINALADIPEVQTVLTRHERVACDIADGYARATNDVGVVLPSQGPGVAHAFAGIAQSYSDGTPVLCLAGQVSRQLIGTQAVQEVQDIDFFRSVAKWVGRINLIERIPEMMRRAFTALRSGQRRPVVLSIPSDISSGEVEDEKLAYDLVAKGWTVGGDPKDIEQAAKALISAKNPLIHAGAGVLYSKAWDELQELAELLLRYAAQHPKVKAKRREIEELRASMGDVDANSADRADQPGHDNAAPEIDPRMVEANREIERLEIEESRLIREIAALRVA